MAHMEYQPHDAWLEKSLAETRRKRRRGYILLGILAAIILVPLLILAGRWLVEVWPPWAVASLIIVFVIGQWMAGAAYRRNKRLAEIEKRLDNLEKGSGRK